MQHHLVREEDLQLPPPVDANQLCNELRPVRRCGNAWSTAAPPLTLAPCQDIKPSTFCEKKTDKCDQSWFQRNCALTCDQCVADSSPPAGPASPPPCRDLKSTTWCAKKLDKCEARPYLQRNCALTCGQCGAD
jgi:hypothetical protein